VALDKGDDQQATTRERAREQREEGDGRGGHQQVVAIDWPSTPVADGVAFPFCLLRISQNRHVGGAIVCLGRLIYGFGHCDRHMAALSCPPVTGER
jgi:hypothetical protein